MRVLILALMLNAPLSAVLPPAWQGVAELKSIFESSELQNYLNSADIIQTITKVDGGWLISTNRSQIRVDVVTEYQSRPGPRRFSLHFSPNPP